MKKILLIIESLMLIAAVAQPPAFKGAEGYGATASGGNSKNVYHVKNLNDDGPGSFRDAVSVPGRTVVFDVSGVISLKSRINVNSNTTINGQTAAHGGITLSGQSIGFSKIHDVIVRYLRLRGNIRMARGSCVLIADSSDKLIFDHVSVSGGRWDNVHIKGSTNTTLQYCLIGESIDPQRFGALLENPVNLSIHHCLWIDNQSRNPKAKAKIELVDNIIYNWGTSGLVGGHSSVDHYQDVISNYFIAGPSSTPSFLAMFTKTDHVYQRGNYVDDNKDGKRNGRPVTDDDFLHAGKGATISGERACSPAIKVSVQSASKAYRAVLKEAGCSITRDTTDQRLIDQLGSLGKKGIIIHS